jgi:uncharacterized membrane protein
MIMKEQTRVARFEPRWPVVLAILVTIVLLALLPERLRLFPGWVLYIVGVVVLAPMAAVGLTAAGARWLRIEQTITLLFIVVAAVVTLANLANLIGAMVHGTVELSGLQLLESSIAVWVINVLMFSLLYWRIDRGGPEARVNDANPRPDWLFPQEGAPTKDVPAGWRPTFVDYLFLGYSTATAFSTTDVMPLTPRAKMLMMLESTISLATIVVVAARAINILGG